MRESPHTAVLYSRAPNLAVKIRRTWGQSAGKALDQQGTLRDFTSGIIRPKRKIKIKSGLLGNLEENPSEIPCRVGKTARNASDRVHNNRLKSVKPYRCRAGTAGNTEGKIAE